MSFLYDKTDKNSILEYAKKLENQTLRNACSDLISTHGYKGKGDFGQVLEKFYFQYKPNSDSAPDFPEAELELKSSRLKQLKNKKYQVKERLVLNVINFIEEAKNKHFETSSFWNKNANLLFVLYLNAVDLDVLDMLIKLVGIWSFPDQDLAIIRQDWATIQNKISSGKAHELSEGDTLYLAACTKGGKGGNPRKQFGSNIVAKQRAYSLKPSYFNHIVAKLAGDKFDNYGKVIQSLNVLEHQTLEEYVVSRFVPFFNQPLTKIITHFDFKLNPISKSFYANLTKKILNVELGKKIEEFEKADIQIKTVRLKPNNLPEQDVSFPCFSYLELATEEWENSEIKEIFQKKFLFIFLKDVEGVLVLEKVKFWNMPNVDLDEVFKVWSKTKDVVNSGTIVRAVKNEKRVTNFPSKKFSNVSHVRPHGANAKDTLPLPVIDLVTNSNEYTKHCFWLNNSYVRDQIYLK